MAPGHLLGGNFRQPFEKMSLHLASMYLHLLPRYGREQRRFNYVTPTSYLALIETFKRLLKGKSEEFMSLKSRYEMGLGKLEFASSQVD